MASEWQPVRKDRSKHQNRPQMSIYADGNGHVNAAGDELLDGPEAVRLLTRPSEGLLRIEPVDEDHLDGYAFSRDEREDRTVKGGDVNFKSALSDLGVDIDALEETTRYEMDGQDKCAVVDLSALPGVGDDSDGEAPGSPADLADHGLDEVTQVAPEDAPWPETVRDAAESVDTLSELADLLDATTPQAARLARDAGVSEDLEDDRPAPMGTPQEGA